MYCFTRLETRRLAPNFKVRPGTPDDAGFVARHWVDGFTNSLSSSERKRLDPKNASGAWSRFCYQHIEAILAQPSVQVRVACPLDDESVIYGVAVVSLPETIHCAFVRPMWRRLGIAAALMQGIDVSHATVTTWCPDLGGHTSSWIIEKHPKIKYTPFFVLAGDAEREQRQQLRRLGAWR